MWSKILLAIPLALILFLGVSHIDEVGDRSCGVRSVHAESFDLPVCQDTCRFRYNIRTDRDQTPVLPSDTPRRRAYEQCLEECERQFYGWDDNS